MFSIICPTYNSEKFIKNTIDSILDQKFSKYEIIFSDDGSLDKTINILNNYSKIFRNKNINCIILQNDHHGPGHARNRALEKANFNWISFIDSDDLWTHDKLQKVNDVILSNKSFNCILHRQFYKSNSGKLKNHDFDKYFKPDLPAHNQIFKTNFLAMSAVTIKKQLIADAGYFNESYQNAQDFDLWLRIGDNFKIYILKEYLGTNIARTGNITSRNYFKRIFNIIKILKYNKEKVPLSLFFYRIIRVILTLEWFKFLTR